LEITGGEINLVTGERTEEIRTPRESCELLRSVANPIGGMCNRSGIHFSPKKKASCSPLPVSLRIQMLRENNYRPTIRK